MWRIGVHVVSFLYNMSILTWQLYYRNDNIYVYIFCRFFFQIKNEKLNINIVTLIIFDVPIIQLRRITLNVI